MRECWRACCSKNLHHAAGEFRVKIGHRFVGEKHLRFLKEGTGQRCALLFSTGHFRRTAIDVCGETQIMKNLESPASVRTWKAGESAPPWIAAEPTAKHIVQQRAISNEQKVLKNDTQSLAEVGWRVAAALRALENNLSLRERHIPRQTTKQTGLCRLRMARPPRRIFPAEFLGSSREKAIDRASSAPLREEVPDQAVGSFASAFGECKRFFERTEMSIRIDLDETGSKYAIAQLRILFFHVNEHVAQGHSVFI